MLKVCCRETEHPSYWKRRKTNWIGHILRRDWRLKHITEGKVERKRRREINGKQILDERKEKILETEKGSTRSHSVENSLWERLWTCNTDYGMTIMIMIMIMIMTRNW